LTLHNKLKRSATPGEEEIMPHEAAETLREYGLQMTVIQDKGRTTALKASVATMYKAYKSGLKDIGLGRALRPFDLNDFADNARLFLIVGFTPSGLKLRTVLARLDGGTYYVMNPDGGTDTAYTGTDLSSFLNAPIMKTPTMPNPLPFAGLGKDYIYTGIAVGIRLLDSSLLDNTYSSLPSTKLEPGNLIPFRTNREFTDDFLKRMTVMEETAKKSGLRLFVVCPDTETCAAMSSQILSACEPLVGKGYRLKVTPFVLPGYKELRIHYY
jgi:hypothetical protein